MASHQVVVQVDGYPTIGNPLEDTLVILDPVLDRITMFDDAKCPSWAWVTLV